MASVPSDRIYLKNLIDEIIESFLKIRFRECDVSEDLENLIKTINDLKYAASLADKKYKF